MKLRILSEQKSYIKKSASAPQIDGQERAFLKYGNGNVDIRYKSLLFKNINRILNKIGVNPIYESFITKKQDDVVYIYIAVNLVYLQSNAYLLKELKKNGNKVSIYCYDCWEPEFADWKKVFDDIGLDYIFFGYKKSSEYFRDLGYNSFWVPLSADYEVFKPYDVNKTRMFMQMGRVNDVLHEKIQKYLQENGLEDTKDNYVYRSNRYEQIFPDINELAKEINKTKYFVCVPKNFENIKRTGNICETICRYYEGMACKTMIIGMKSDTFDELFPYKAMISFNNNEDFNKQIQYYETHQDEYNEIVNKNYDYIMKNHTWGNRVDSILNIINDKKV